MTINSKQKGKRAELELCHELNCWIMPCGNSPNARRGQQFKGTQDSPDILHDIPYVFIECKADKRVDIGTKDWKDAWAKARKEAPSNHRVWLIWKKPLLGWMVTDEEISARKHCRLMTSTLENFLLSLNWRNPAQ